MHKVVEQLDSGAHVIEQADGHGSTKVVNGAELQMCPPSELQKTPGRARRQRVPMEPQQADSSDDDSHP